MHLASTNYKSTHRCDFYVEWPDDADCHAIRLAPPSSSGRIHNLQDGGPRRGVERPSSYLGDLQHCRSKVRLSFYLLAFAILIVMYRQGLTLKSVATGYGQPPSTIYDWALEPASLKDADYRLPTDLTIRLRIEKFCDRVTKALYSSKPEPGEFISAEKLVIVQILESELREMEVEFGRDISGRSTIIFPITGFQI